MPKHLKLTAYISIDNGEQHGDIDRYNFMSLFLKRAADTQNFIQLNIKKKSTE